MIAVDTKDFCVPSDENDYDELVAFADTIAGIQTHEVIPIEVLDKIRAEIDSHCSDNRDRNDGLYIAMKIIDKYRNEVNE